MELGRRIKRRGCHYPWRACSPDDDLTLSFCRVLLMAISECRFGTGGGADSCRSRCVASGSSRPIVLKNPPLRSRLVQLRRALEGSSPLCGRWGGGPQDELSHLAEVLSGGCEEELFSCAVWTAQAVQPQDALEARE